MRKDPQETIERVTVAGGQGHETAMRFPSLPNPRPVFRSGLPVLAFLLAACLDGGLRAEAPAERAVPVSVGPQGMLRGGQPYFVKGAGGGGSMEQLAARGGNSLRTWTTNDLGPILDEASRLGLTVSAGIWLEPECSWFSYSNPDHCARQVERVRKEVTAYRDHPALLAWGLGNEVEGDGSDAAFWKQINRLALLVDELDPAHPTFTAVAGFNAVKAAGMQAHAPRLDFVGINTYGAAVSVRRHLEKMAWKRPWMLTEWGPKGFWESPKSRAGAPLEQTSTEKSGMVREVYQKVIRPEGGCMGSYVFVWGWKFEATATWFGIFTHEGETTAVADSLQEVWSGNVPTNRAPGIGRIEGVPATDLKAGESFEARVTASDPEGDPLEWRWAVLPEAARHDGGKKLPMPKPAEGALTVSGDSKAVVTTPAKPGVYRLHVWVKDGKGHVATANQPFAVR